MVGVGAVADRQGERVPGSESELTGIRNRHEVVDTVERDAAAEPTAGRIKTCTADERAVVGTSGVRRGRPRRFGEGHHATRPASDFRVRAGESDRAAQQLTTATAGSGRRAII